MYINLNDFLNRIRTLHCIDGYELAEILTPEQTRRFLKDPINFMLTSDSARGSAIWKLVEKRYTDRDIIADVPDVADIPI